MPFGLLGGLGHLPPTSSADIQIFRGGGATGNAQVNRAIQVWDKPNGASMIYLFCGGPGGGGGGGGSAATNLAKSGGAAGASGAGFNLLVPAMFMPDSLFLSPGSGGLGGGVGLPGADAGVTEIAWPGAAVALTSTLIKLQGAGGGGGPGGGGGSPQAGPTQTTVFLCGLYLAFAGIAGGSGGVSTGGTGAQSLFCSGSGGGGVNSSNVASNGGNVPMTAGLTDVFPGYFGGLGHNATAGDNGQSGFNEIQPLFFSLGGEGGGGSGTSTGGNGGSGGPCCGGGGGGAGITGGPGGNGGDGLIIIVSW